MAQHKGGMKKLKRMSTSNFRGSFVIGLCVKPNVLFNQAGKILSLESWLGHEDSAERSKQLYKGLDVAQ